MAQFPGIYVALITPFTASGEVDYPRLQEHVDWIIGEGVHGLVPTGSCGEYAALSDMERAQVVETIIQTAAGRVPVVVGTAAPSTAKAIGWAHHAKEAGAAGIMVLPPINYRPNRREVVAWYGALSEVGIPIIAYNNPYDTSTDLTPDLIAEIAQFESVVAVKEFSGDVRRIPHILADTRLEVLAGADDVVLESIFAGATGWIAGLTNVLPRESVHLYELGMAGKVVEANELYRRLLPLFRFDARPIFVQAIKYAFELMGNPVGETRAPRLPLNDATKQSVAEAYAIAIGQ
ncbi:MAG: dihydrodipicolinate synthase family protein [Chloroflexota bacterium]